MKKIYTYLLTCLIASVAFGQKKELDHSVYDVWNRIEGREISRDGKWISYFVKPVGYGDPELFITDIKANKLLYQERGSNPTISFNSE